MMHSISDTLNVLSNLCIRKYQIKFYYNISYSIGIRFTIRITLFVEENIMTQI